MDQDASLWVYLTNFSPGPFKKRVWRGDKTKWEEAVRRLIQGNGPLLQSFSVVQTKPSERRLVLRANTKGARAQLIGAIRGARSRDIRVSAALTLQEQAHRAFVHREAQVANLIVVDRGDRCHLLPKGGPKPKTTIPIDYSGAISDIQKAIEDTKKALKEIQNDQPPPKRDPPRTNSLRQPGRSYREAASGQHH